MVSRRLSDKIYSLIYHTVFVPTNVCECVCVCTCMLVSYVTTVYDNTHIYAYVCVCVREHVNVFCITRPVRNGNRSDYVVRVFTIIIIVITVCTYLWSFKDDFLRNQTAVEGENAPKISERIIITVCFLLLFSPLPLPPVVGFFPPTGCCPERRLKSEPILSVCLSA